jgi:hypothetical protein
MTTLTGRPTGFRPDGFRPDNFTPQANAAAPGGYTVFSQPTADVNAVKTELASLPLGTTTYLLTGTPGSVQWLYIRAISACGVADDEPIRPKLRRVAFDALGALIPDVPNAPIGLTLKAGPGGLVTATWAYIDIGQMAPPAGFNIYTTTGVTPFDYNTPAGNVTPSRGMSFGAAFAHGTLARFVVRAATAAGDEEPNTTEKSITADAVAPAAPDSLVVELIP